MEGIEVGEEARGVAPSSACELPNPAAKPGDAGCDEGVITDDPEPIVVLVEERRRGGGDAIFCRSLKEEGEETVVLTKNGEVPDEWARLLGEFIGESFSDIRAARRGWRLPLTSTPPACELRCCCRIAAPADPRLLCAVLNERAEAELEREAEERDEADEAPPCRRVTAPLFPPIPGPLDAIALMRPLMSERPEPRPDEWFDPSDPPDPVLLDRASGSIAASFEMVLEDVPVEPSVSEGPAPAAMGGRRKGKVKENLRARKR